MEQNGNLSDHLLVEEIKKRLEEKNKLLLLQSQTLAEMEDLNTKLRQAEQVKSGFLSNIRNEINNPLTSIIGLAHQITIDTRFDLKQI